jgi:neutral ceramidase
MLTGCFECDITPPMGMERPGNYTKAYVTWIRDPLKVRAAVFDNGATRAAVVSVDTCTIDSRAVAQARDRIQSRCGIPAENIMIAASHTHSGGPLFGFLASDFSDAPRRVRDLAVNESIIIDPVYLEWTIAQITTAVALADKRKLEAYLSFDTGRVPGITYNRRFKMKNGRVYSHPGKANPDTVAPAGPVDEEVGVLGLWQNEALIGCVINFGCHATTNIDGVSADWIFHLEQTIRGSLGKDAIVLFLCGAAGDVTQFDNQSMREDEFGPYWSRLIGNSVGAEVVRLLVNAQPAPASELKVVSSRVKVPRREPSPERLAKARKLIDGASAPPEANEWLASAASTEYLMSKELLVLDYVMARQRSIDLEIQAMQIGSSLWVTNGAEFFAESGLAIKKGSAFPKTQVVTLANSALGYVPPTAAYEPDGGGYETVLTSYSNLAVTAVDTIISESLNLSRQFTAPEPAKAPSASAKQPWTYGVLGPDLH